MHSQCIAHNDCDVTVWSQCKQSHDQNDETDENIKRKFEPKKKNTQSQVWLYFIIIITIRAHISEALHYGFIDGNLLICYFVICYFTYYNIHKPITYRW